jgi:outer membrane protein assembly factor BamE
MRLCAAAAVLPLIGGCSSLFTDPGAMMGIFTPYRIDVQQGNVVTQEQLARVKPGMTRLQVRDAMGSPLLADTFHANRWDYIFTLRKGNTEVQRRSVVLLFDGDVLKNIEAPELPTEREFIATIARSGRVVSAAQLELGPERLENLPIPPRTPPVLSSDGIPNPIPATRTFPPLEPS